MKHTTMLILMIVSMMIAACSAPTPAPMATPQPEPTPTATLEPEPAAIPTPATLSYEPTFEPASCPFTLPPTEVEGKTVQCGYVVVPQDRSNPQTESIRLAVVVLKAQSDKPIPDPVILLSGGPGEKTVENAVAAASILAPFRDQRDVIVFDQRGVGLSEPALECPEMVQARFDLLDELDPETGLRTLFDAAMACRDRLVKEGHNLSAYNTTENAADVDDIRRALGYEQLNLYGGSYGSLLAQAVLRDHPEGLRSVIIGAVLPAEKSFFVNVPTTVVSATLRLLEACADDEACNAAYPNLKQALFDTIDKLNADPVPITVTNPADGKSYETWLTGDDVFGNLVVFLYFTEIIPVLPQAISNVANGDYELMTQLTSTRLQLFDALSTGMELSVLCAEDLIDVTPQDYLAERAKMPQPLAGRADPEDIIEYSFFGMCENWPVEQAELAIKQPVVSDVPTLILEGEFDPVTPLAYAQAVAEHLSNNYLYEFPGIGHNVLVASPCARRIALDFVEDPTEAPDASCIGEMPGVVFDLPKEEAAGITLEPFVIEQAGLSGVAPAGWKKASAGTFVRQQNALDPTALIYDIAPTDEAGFRQLIQAQLQLDQPPESVGQRETESFPWTLYSVEVRGVVVDMAATQQDDETTLIVLLQSKPDERDSLYELVFLPAVDELKPLSK
jgi:pimeloyl-ACP methyl ester carboxylesterase